MGGAFCYVSREYSGRVKTIVRSWRIANNIKEEEAVDAEETCHKVKRVGCLQGGPKVIDDFFLKRHLVTWGF